MALSVSLTACAGTSSSSTTPKDYTQIIMDTRTDDLNESYAITAGQNGEQPTLSLDPNGTDEEQAKSMIEMQMSTLGPVSYTHLDPAHPLHFQLCHMQ